MVSNGENVAGRHSRCRTRGTESNAIVRLGDEQVRPAMLLGLWNQRPHEDYHLPDLVLCLTNWVADMMPGSANKPSHLRLRRLLTATAIHDTKERSSARRNLPREPI